MTMVTGRQVRQRVGLRIGPVLALALVVGAAAPIPAEAAPRAYTMDLGVRSDFVAQTNFVQCVGASMQMMLNMIRPGADRTAATQRRLQAIARALSGPAPDGFERQGASVLGWASALNQLGAGPYDLLGTDTIDEALLAAARAIRLTGKPVGLLMWHGRHAWVMSGFRATTDPLDPGARVTAVYVEDPLYPFGSSSWGPSPAPGSALTPAELGRQFVPRRSSSHWPATPWGTQLAGKYVLVLPVKADPRPYLRREM
jgi:hypothetical protein